MWCVVLCVTYVQKNVLISTLIIKQLLKINSKEMSENSRVHKNHKYHTKEKKDMPTVSRLQTYGRNLEGAYLFISGSYMSREIETVTRSDVYKFFNQVKDQRFT